MSGTEALARVLYFADTRGMRPALQQAAWDDMGGSEPSDERAAHEIHAAAIVADPGPLLAALAEAGVLHRQTRRLERGGPREGRYATVEPDGRVEGGDGLATDWEAT